MSRRSVGRIRSGVKPERMIASGRLLHSNEWVTGRVLRTKGENVALQVNGRKVFVKADSLRVVRLGKG